MQKKRKWIRKKTKEKIKKLLKEMIVKGYIYSNNEARRFGLEDRELKYYLGKYLNKKEIYNEHGNNRKNYKPNKAFEKILNTTIKELITFEDKETIDFIKLII